MRAAPRGHRVALSNHRNEVLIGDVATGELTVVDRSDHGRTEDLAWSPDAAWLAYSFWTSTRHSAIKLHDVARGKGTLVTKPEFRDYAPSFDPDGRYLYFLSLRTFDPVYDSVQFELSFPRAARPYLIALQAGGRPPFEPVPKGLAPDDPARAPARKAGPGRAAADRARRHRAAHRRVPGAREPVRADRRRGRRQGDLVGDADCRRARPRRPQGGSRPTRAVRLRHVARRDADGARGRVRPRRRRGDARRARRQAAARDRREPQAGAGARPRGGVGGPVAQERLARSRSHPRVGRATARVAADAARGVAPAARPVLGPRHVGHRLGSGLPPLRAAARARRDPRRALGPDLGDAGRARHVARLRDGRRLSPAAAGAARLPRRRRAARRQGRQLRDHADRHRRSLGAGGRLAAQRRRRRGEARRAHRRGERAEDARGPPAAVAARPPGRRPGRAHARAAAAASRRRRATCW